MQTSRASQAQRLCPLPSSSSSSSSNTTRSNTTKSRQPHPPSTVPSRPPTRTHRHPQYPHATHLPTVAHRAPRASPAAASSASSSTGARDPTGSTPSDPTYPLAYPPPTMASSMSSLVQKPSRQSVCLSSSLGVHPAKRSSSLAHMNRPLGRIRPSSSMSECCFPCPSLFLFVMGHAFEIRVRGRAHCFLSCRAARMRIPNNGSVQ